MRIGLNDRYTPPYHPTFGTNDPSTEDYFTRHSTGFYIVFGLVLGTIALFSLYALWRGPTRQFWICGCKPRQEKKERQGKGNSDIIPTTIIAAEVQGSIFTTSGNGNGKEGVNTMYLTDIRRQTLPATSTPTPTGTSTPTTAQTDNSGRQPLMINNASSFSPTPFTPMQTPTQTPSSTPPIYRPQPSTPTSFSPGPTAQARSTSAASTPPPNVSVSFSPDLPSPMRSGTVPPNRHKTNISWAPESYTSPRTPEASNHPRSRSPTLGFGAGGNGSASPSPSIGRSRAIPFAGNTTPIGTLQPAPWRFLTTPPSPQITRPAAAAYPNPPLIPASPPLMTRPATSTATRPQPSMTPPPLIARPATSASNTFPARSTYTPSPRGPSRSKSVSSGPEQTGGGGDYFGPAPWNTPSK